VAALCEAYWYPLYAYVRRQGHGVDEAQDLTQAFFTRFLDKEDIQDVRRDRGKFRSFLLASMKHFLLNRRASLRAAKRGGGVAPLPLEFEIAERRYALEPVDAQTPETVFERRWALTVLDRVLARLRRDALAAGRGAEFDQLKRCLTGDATDMGYCEIGAAIGMSEGVVKVAVHRLRRRYRKFLREEISSTVLTDAAVDDEIRHLVRVLSAS
jgi:RNA polymerase sigma-70 factor (ECF subfamily)